MRRFGKTAVMLVYKEGSHLVADTPEDKADYVNRQLQWWDHYLLGKPAPAWITDAYGVKPEER